MTRLLLNVLVIAAINACAGGTVTVPTGNLITKPLENGRIAHLLERQVGTGAVSIDRFQRDSTGSRLFICFSFRLGSEEAYRTAIVSSNGISIVSGFPMVYYDDSGDPTVRLQGGSGRYDSDGRLSWHNDEARFVFKDGSSLPYGSVSNLKCVTGGEYVIVNLTNEAKWSVTQAENSRRVVLELPNHFNYAQGAYFAGNKFVVFGTSSHSHGGSFVSCFVYEKSSLDYKLAEEIQIPWAGRVYDLNMNTGDALMTGTAQMFPKYYRFNIWTKRRTSLGVAPADCVFFLNEDVVRTLNAAIRGAK